MNAQFTADTAGFVNMINARAIVFGMGREEAFRLEAKLLAEELIQRTPPFSGKAVAKMLAAQGKSLSEGNLEIKEMTARKVGERAVEKDIRRIIYGTRGAAPPDTSFGSVKVVQPAQGNYKDAKAAERARKKLERGINKQRNKFGKQLLKDGGVLQKIRGKDAVRVFATKDGTVYGVDVEMFRPKASPADLEKVHQMARTKRGRTSQAGMISGKKVGRWKWLNKMVTREKTVRKYIRKKLKQVGQAKGGWAAAFMRFGGKMSMSGWIGEHASRFGRVRSSFTNDKIEIEMTNQSSWASSGDPDRIIPKALAGRTESLKAAIWRQMNDAWKKGGEAGRVNLPA